MTEHEFTDQVIQLSQMCGWRTIHLRPARTATGWRTAVQGDGVGFPDLLMIREDVLIVAELKIGKAKPTHEQAAWLSAFAGVGALVYTWTPDNWQDIVVLLKGEDHV